MHRLSTILLSIETLFHPPLPQFRPRSFASLWKPIRDCFVCPLSGASHHWTRPIGQYSESVVGEWLMGFIYLLGRIIAASPEMDGCPRYPQCRADGSRPGFGTTSDESLRWSACTSPRICCPRTAPSANSILRT